MDRQSKKIDSGRFDAGLAGAWLAVVVLFGLQGTEQALREFGAGRGVAGGCRWGAVLFLGDEMGWLKENIGAILLIGGIVLLGALTGGGGPDCYGSGPTRVCEGE